MDLTLDGNRLVFSEPLKQAQIIGRPNRFIVLADLDGEDIDCHCAVPGTIGGVVLDGLPCLVSGPYDQAKRATPYSIEALSFYLPEDPLAQWIGINQTGANSYVEAALRAGWLDPIVKPTEIRREKTLGSSRIDFLVNNDTFIEVKMPVDNLQLDPPAELPKRWPMASKGMDRAGRQVTDLTAALQAGQRAVILTLFCYDNDGTWREWPYRRPKVKQEQTVVTSPSSQAFATARAAGLESWRLSLRFTPTHLEFLRLEQVTQW